MNEILVFLQENWQWMFALVCVGLYFKGKKNYEANEPKNKLEEIGQKAEALIEEKAEEFVEKIEEEALEALEEKLDSLDEQAIEVIKEIVELATEVKEEPKKSEWSYPSQEDFASPEQYQDAVTNFVQKLKIAGYQYCDWTGYPDPSKTSKNRVCPCGSGETYRNCHAPDWKPNPS